MNNGQVRKIWRAAAISGLSNIKSIEAGPYGGLALTQSGELYRWGLVYDRVYAPTKWQEGIKIMAAGYNTIHVVKMMEACGQWARMSLGNWGLDTYKGLRGWWQIRILAM